MGLESDGFALSLAGISATSQYLELVDKIVPTLDLSDDVALWDQLAAHLSHLSKLWSSLPFHAQMKVWRPHCVNIAL